VFLLLRRRGGFLACTRNDRSGVGFFTFPEAGSFREGGFGPAAQGFEQALVASGVKQIGPVPAAQAVGYLTRFQPQGDEENRAFGLLVGHIQHKFDLFLHIAGFGCGRLRKANQNYIHPAHGLANFIIPILAGQ
jgi:hypothetical protein